MRVFFELIRILLIAAVLGGIGATLLNQLYMKSGASQSFVWLGFLAVWLLIFVLYRNKLQFTGWYKDKGGSRLPRSVTASILSISIILIVIPFFIK